MLTKEMPELLRVDQAGAVAVPVEGKLTSAISMPCASPGGGVTVAALTAADRSRSAARERSAARAFNAADASAADNDDVETEHELGRVTALAGPPDAVNPTAAASPAMMITAPPTTPVRLGFLIILCRPVTVGSLAAVTSLSWEFVLINRNPCRYCITR
jgi:hypothetical protein